MKYTSGSKDLLFENYIMVRGLDDMPDLVLERIVGCFVSMRHFLAFTLACKRLSRIKPDKRCLRVNIGNEEQFTPLLASSLLPFLHTLDMSRCTGITNVSALAGIHTLYMSWCTGITDVSALAGIHTLDMYGCTRITDVSALAGIHTLYMYGCIRVTVVSALAGIHTLNISDCAGITDVSALAGIHTLCVYWCPQITPENLEALREAHSEAGFSHEICISK